MREPRKDEAPGGAARGFWGKVNQSVSGQYATRSIALAMTVGGGIPARHLFDAVMYRPPRDFPPRDFDVDGATVRFTPLFVCHGPNVAFAINHWSASEAWRPWSPERFRHLVRLGGHVWGIDQFDYCLAWPHDELGQFPT